MEILIIILLVLYAGFKDYMNYKEREKLELKLMSKSVDEYVASVAPYSEENTKSEENPVVPIEEASYEEILKARDVL